MHISKIRVASATSTRLFFLIAFFGLGGFAFGQRGEQSTDADVTKLLALERSWNQAQLTADSHAMDFLMSDRFVDTEWDGRVFSKAKFLADVTDISSKPTSNVNSDMKVEVYGDAAVVTGAYHATGTYKGKRYDYSGRFTDTWVRKGAGWQCVASQWNRNPEKR